MIVSGYLARLPHQLPRCPLAWASGGQAPEGYYLELESCRGACNIGQRRPEWCNVSGTSIKRLR
jgi:hypothetical protein